MSKYIFAILILFGGCVGCDNYFVLDDSMVDSHSIGSNDTETDSNTNTGQDPNILFETGFEEGLPGSVEGDGVTSINTNATYVVSGQNSFRADITGSQFSAGFVVPFGPVTSGELHFRAHYYLVNGPAGGLVNIMEFLNNQGMDVYDVNIRSNLSVNLHSFIDYASSDSPEGTIQLGRWFCLSAQFFIADDMGSVNVFIDDNLVLSTPTNLDTLPDGGIVGMRVGIVNADDSVGPLTFYLDDLALSTAPLDC